MGKAGNMSYCKNPQKLRLGDSSMDDGGDGAVVVARVPRHVIRWEP